MTTSMFQVFEHFVDMFGATIAVGFETRRQCGYDPQKLLPYIGTKLA